MVTSGNRHGFCSVALAITLAATFAATIPTLARTALATPGTTGQPGDVVSAAPAVFTMDPVLHTPVPGVRVTRVLYRSTTAAGEPNTVSGTVLVPTTAYPGRRPLVGYAVGTHGLGDDCAPSHETRPTCSPDRTGRRTSLAAA